MGRRPDSPELQERKGNPNKRPASLAARRKQANELARRLADYTAAADALSPPAWLSDPDLKLAVALWHEDVPQLARINFARGLDRNMLAIYYVYMAEGIQANRRILTHGTWMLFEGSQGQERPWNNPDVKIRDTAFDVCQRLAKEFGLTFASRVGLMKDRAAAALAGDLFDPPPELPAPAHVRDVPDVPDAIESGGKPAQPDSLEDLIGLGRRLNTPRPTSIN